MFYFLGCGKSTQVPQYLYEQGWHTKGIIGITQPRRIAAFSLADRVASELGEVVGDTVGVSVRFHHLCSDDTAIRYITEGILLREMLSDNLLSKYKVIMIDEAHERNTTTDLLISLLKAIASKRDDLKLIIASATLDADFFQNYLNLKKDANSSDTSVILEVEGRSFPIETFYLNKPVPCYVKETVETIMKIHRKKLDGGILAFLTGQDEIKQATDLLNKHMEQSTSSGANDDMYIVPFYGTLHNSELVKVFFTPPNRSRKVVIATNIAETSITIPGIGFVVDCGFVKMKFFRHDLQSELLLVVPISKAVADQRAGRAGRTQSGKVFRLYTEEEYKKLPAYTPPEICRSDICSPILQLKALGISNVAQFDYPTPIPANNFIAAIEVLLALKAIDSKANLTDPVGFFMAPLPLSPLMGKMLWQSAEMGCSEEILIIIAMLQVKSVFSKGSGTGQETIDSKRHRYKYAVAEGDLISYLNVYKDFVESGKTKEFCGRNWLIYKNLKRATEIRAQLAEYVKFHHKLPMLSTSNTEVILRCIVTGFFPNAAYLHHSGDYRKIRGDIVLNVHPQSVLYTQKPTEYVIYTELEQSYKIFMKDITVIQGDWLTELASHYYHVTNEPEHPIFNPC